MRIALLSAVKRTPEGELRADQMLAGRSVLAWQVEQALKYGCERIICLGAAPAQNILEQQQRVEAKGFAFHTVRSPSQIGGLVREQNQLLIVLDGLLLSDETLSETLGECGSTVPTILALPSDHPLTAAHPDDFERIDANRHWAGVALIPGNCAELLEEMPVDGNAVSLLLRLGLQARVPCREVQATLLDSDQWLLTDGVEVLGKREKMLLDANIAQPHWSGPSTALAAVIIRKTAPKWLTSRSGIVGVAALSLMGFAVALASFGFPIVGLAVAVIGAFAANFTMISARLRAGVMPDTQTPLPFRYLSAVIAVLTAIVLGLADTQSSTLAVQVTVPILVIGLAWLAGKGHSEGLSAFWQDTASHLILFVIAASAGFLQEVVLVFSLGALLTLLMRAGKISDKPLS